MPEQLINDESQTQPNFEFFLGATGVYGSNISYWDPEREYDASNRHSRAGGNPVQ